MAEIPNDVDRLKSIIPSQDDLSEKEEYLLPTTMVYTAHGGRGKRYSALRIRVIEKHIEVDESKGRERIVERIHSPIPSQERLEVGDEYLFPTTMVYKADSGGERYEAVKIKIVGKNVDINESAHKVSEGYT